MKDLSNNFHTNLHFTAYQPQLCFYLFLIVYQLISRAHILVKRQDVCMSLLLRALKAINKHVNDISLIIMTDASFCLVPLILYMKIMIEQQQSR